MRSDKGDEAAAHHLQPRSIFLRSAAHQGVVIVHGFTASPSEVLELGQFLHQHSFQVAMPLLPGHGTRLSDLDQVRSEEWIAAAEAVYLQLRETCTEIFLIGLSMGGHVVFQLARRFPEVRGIVGLAVPYWVKSKATHGLLSFLDQSGLWPFVVRKNIPKKSHFRPKDGFSPRFAYAAFPPSGLRTFLRFVNRSRKNLGQIRAPVLLMHSRTDDVTPAGSMGQLAKAFQERPETLLLEGFDHVMTCDAKRQEIFAMVLEFLQRHRLTRTGS